MAEDTVPADVFALFDDEYARDILKATNRKPMPARQLAEELGVSRSTVYQRIKRLQARSAYRINRLCTLMAIIGASTKPVWTESSLN